MKLVTFNYYKHIRFRTISSFCLGAFPEHKPQGKNDNNNKHAINWQLLLIKSGKHLAKRNLRQALDYFINVLWLESPIFCPPQSVHHVDLPMEVLGFAV